jgi:hypothetical protein
MRYSSLYYDEFIINLRGVSAATHRFSAPLPVLEESAATPVPVLSDAVQSGAKGRATKARPISRRGATGEGTSVVYNFTNPIYILLMVLLFGAPLITPVLYAHYRSVRSGFDLEGQIMLGLLFTIFLGAYGTILLLGIFPTATAQVLEQVPLVTIPGAIP